MFVYAPARARLARTAQQRKPGATSVVRGRAAFAGGEPRVLTEIAAYAACVLGGVVAWMSWQLSRRV
jgi:hypothetical protein